MRLVSIRDSVDRQGVGITAAMTVVAPPLVAALAAATGGTHSPWLGLIPVPIILAGFQSMMTAAATATWTSVLYAGLVHLTAGSRGWRAEDTGHVLAFYVVGLAVAWLVRRREAGRRDEGQDAAAARSALDISQMMNAAYDLDMTLDLIILQQRRLVQADSFAILLAHDDVLRVHAQSGAVDEQTVFPADRNDGGWNAGDGRSLEVSDTERYVSSFAKIDPEARSFILVPMTGVERVIGLLYFGSRRPDAFPASVVQAAERLAANVVFPVQRAQLEEDLKRFAYTDAQTALFNHRRSQEQLEEEIRRGQRYGRPVSLMLMDVDAFKSFNDTYGHPAGDEILRKLANTVRETLRSVDIAARYGGEEFAVICPETNGEQAVMLAERLCLQIADTVYSVQNAAVTRITVSIGVAAYPADASVKNDLISAADHALYEAKRQGKNRVVAFKDCDRGNP